MVALVSMMFVTMIYMARFKWLIMESLILVLAVLGLWEYSTLECLNYYVISMFLMVDWLSMMLIMLSFFISSLMLSASYSSILFKNKMTLSFLIFTVMMLFFLVFCFLSAKVIYFYVFFEAALIPIFLMVMGWGSQPERLQAAIYMLFYTLFASLPLLVVIMLCLNDFSNFLFMNQFGDLSFSGLVLSFFFIFAFLVKLPMFLVHLWLPKAHVEAPVAGSMILAGVLLKLGGYGVWRIVAFLVKSFSVLSIMWIVLGMIGGVIVSFICSMQVDMKSLVAYSSVVHMGIVLAGLSVLTFVGFEGVICMMLGHGLVSSGLFYMVGVFYDRAHSRSLLVAKGMMSFYPYLVGLWFIFCIFNISAPPSVSLLGEILLTLSILQWSVWMGIWLMMMNLMSMVYTFYLYAQSQQGKPLVSILSMYSVNPREILVSLAHLASVFSLLMIFWLLY